MKRTCKHYLIVALLPIVLGGCTVGYVSRNENLCISLGAGSCSYDAGSQATPAGSTDVRGQFISAEIAQAVAGIVDGFVRLGAMVGL